MQGLIQTTSAKEAAERDTEEGWTSQANLVCTPSGGGKFCKDVRLIDHLRAGPFSAHVHRAPPRRSRVLRVLDTLDSPLQPRSRYVSAMSAT